MIVNNSLVPVNEAYYGRPKELIAVMPDMQKIVDASMSVYTTKSTGEFQIDGDSINQSASVKRVEEALRKVFNFKRVTLNMYSSPSGLVLGISENAFTIPQVIMKIADRGPRRMKDPSAMTASVFVDAGLIYKYKLTADELMGIILHEIGHNIDASIPYLIASIIPTLENGLILAITSTVLNSIMGQAYSIVTKAIETAIDSVPSLRKALYWIVERPVMFIRKLRGALSTATFAQYIFSPQWWRMVFNARNVFGYSGEMYADSVATAYGYGVGLSSAMQKLDSAHSNINVAPITAVRDVYKVACSLLFAAIDEHPMHMTRVYSQLKKLKKELNDPNMPKQYRKEVKEQIDELEAICDRMTDIRSNAKNGMVLSAIVNKIIKELNGHSDPREMINIIFKAQE